jgi:hypothetical protein
MQWIKIVLAGVLVIVVGYVLYANTPFFPPASRSNEGKILIQTQWMGEGFYAKFTPEPKSNTLGCWSTTFAQISYYHRLQPSGISKYDCSKGYKIYQDLDAHKFDWHKFRKTITDTTSLDIIDEISRYCYSIATVVQKDFGTGRYITKLPSIKNIENQLAVDAALYLAYKGFLQSRRKIKNIVMREIEARRPLYMYYRNMRVKGSGHSVVLDGYRVDKDGFKVHLNFGWGGRKDGWYNLFDSIATEGDTELRVFITVKPLARI